MVKYKQLKKQHESYSAGAFRRMELLFGDPAEICKPENAALFIHQHQSEHIDAYRDRLKEAVYIPIYSTIVHYISDFVFEKELTVQDRSGKKSEYWKDFSRGSDRLRKTSFQDQIKQTGTRALAFSSAWLGYDFPEKKTEEGASLFEVAESGEMNAYCFQVDAKEIIDFQYDDHDRLEWVKLCRRIDAPSSPLDETSEIITEFKIWEMLDGIAHFSIYQKKHKCDYLLIDSDEFDEIKIREATSFDEIPLKKLELPDGLSMKVKIMDLCAKLFRNKTTFEFAKRRAAYPVPYIKLAGEYPDGSADTFSPADPGKVKSAAQAAASKGLIPLSEKDELGFLQADSACFALLSEDLEKHSNYIYQQANLLSQSVAATTMGAGRSAASKVMDNAALNTAAEELGSIFRAFALEVCSAIARARGEDIEFEAYGLDNFQQTDQEVILKNALALNAINLPSKEFKKRYMLLCAVNMLPSLDREAEALIKEEIDSAVDKEPDDLYEKEEQEEVNDARGN